LAYLWKLGFGFEKEFSPVSAVQETELSIITKQLEMKINTVPTSSMGRLFDAVSSLIGVCQHAGYEGQAAIELENAIDDCENGLYEIPLSEDTIFLKPLFDQIVRDLHQRIPKEVISTRFHNGIIRLILDICQLIRTETGLTEIALSGGVWQNMYLFTHTVPQLSSAGFNVLVHHRVPANDGGISLGQLAVCNTQIR
jgi:hydrogenase maturation protein HypF